MKSRVVKELKEKFNIRKVNGEKVERMTMYELVHVLDLARRGINSNE